MSGASLCTKSAYVVERGAGIGLVDHHLDVLADLRIVVDVVVPRVDIRLDMVVVAGRVVLDQPRRIQTAGQCHHLLNPAMAVVHAVLGQAPGLVEEHPGEDRGRVEIAGDGTRQRGLVHAAHGRRVQIGAGNVVHDEQAQAVGPVVVARVVDLDVAAQHVEAQILGQLNVAADDIVGRIAVESIGMEGLVQCAAQIDRLAVEQDVLVGLAVPLGAFDSAHAEVALDRIYCAVCRLKFGHKVVEEGRLGAPELGIGHGDRHLNLLVAGSEIEWETYRWKNIVLGGDGQRELAGLGNAQIEAHLRLLAGNIGRHAHILDVVSCSRLQPDRTPDAAAVGVPTGHLLADHGAGIGHIEGAHNNEGGFAWLDEAREVNREGQIAVVVLAGEDAVDPDTRLPVDRFEVEIDALACPLARHEDLSFVPGCALVIDAFDAGQLALPREGHVDRQILGPALPRRTIEVGDLTG